MSVQLGMQTQKGSQFCFWGSKSHNWFFNLDILVQKVIKNESKNDQMCQNRRKIGGREDVRLTQNGEKSGLKYQNRRKIWGREDLR